MKTKIDKEHKMLIGGGYYNKSSTHCVFCEGKINIRGNNQEDVLGFDYYQDGYFRKPGVIDKRLTKVFRCPHCFEKLWNHCAAADYRRYQRWYSQEKL